MLQIVNVPIHPAALVACPEVDFKMRKAAKNCPGCDHYDGIGMMNSDNELTWDARFTIRCCHPMERRTYILEVVD